MRKVEKGQRVMTPSGRKATVKDITREHTGRRGRPAHLAKVQEWADRGGFLPGFVEYHPATLRPAN